MRIADLVMIILFLAGMAGMGVYFARRSRSTEAYFLGNRSFPGWAIGLSMLGTSISSVTFLALPAAAFVLDYRQLVPNLSMPVVALLAMWLIIPFFRSCTATSAFEYLEKRYGASLRLYAAASFIVIQLLRLATILYLVAIPMAEMLGIGMATVIVVSGIVVGFYTVTGGIEAVIWTDVVQTIILLGGGILCLLLIVHALPGGFGEVFRVGAEFDKFSPGPLELNFSGRTLPVMILLGIVNFGTEYISNQNVVQRYIAAKSLSEARRATLMCAFMSVPTWLCFFFLGTCLFVYYKAFPNPEVARMIPDQVLPYFILNKTPPGVAGIIIAACLAAAMSSLSSSINAVSTIGTVDFLKRFRPECPDRTALRHARLYALLATLIMIAGAIGICYIPKESVNDMSLIVSSLFGGGMFAIFLLGFFSTRVGNRAILTGLAAGLGFNLYMMLNSLGLLPEALRCGVHSYWTTILVNALLFLIAWAASWFTPNRRDLTGLTVWTKTPHAAGRTGGAEQERLTPRT